MHQSNTSHVWTIHGCNLEKLLVFKAIQVGWQVHQSTSRLPPTRGPSMFAIQNNYLFLGLYDLVDECTSPPVHPSTRQKPPTHGRSMYAIWNNSLFLGLFWVGRRDSSELPHMDDPCMQSGITPCFRALPSQLTRLFQVGVNDPRVYRGGGTPGG